MVYAPPAVPTVFRTGFGYSRNYFVDATGAFYTATIFASPQATKLFELADGGATPVTSYVNVSAYDGRLQGNTAFLLFTAFDLNASAGGVVRRVPRAAGPLPCDYGGTANKRPYGVFADATHVYWANQGGGAAPPYTGGSVVMCEAAATCCATPDVLWTGDGPTGVTGDAEALYFATAAGNVWKIAKP